MSSESWSYLVTETKKQVNACQGLGMGDGEGAGVAVTQGLKEPCGDTVKMLDLAMAT